MKKFLLNISIFTLTLACLYGVLFLITPKGIYGADYVRVSSPEYPSLILGSSMAARGLSPAVFQQSLGEQYEFPMMNFAFNIGVSPYGKLYYERVAEKLKKNKNQNSLFILSIDPYSIADFGEESEEHPREEQGLLATLGTVTGTPNWEYFFNNILFTKSFVTFKFDKSTISVDEFGFDGSLLEVKTHPEWKVRENIEQYILPYYQNDVIHTYRVSATRWHYLAKTIELLKENGDVFLVRMPFEAELFDVTEKVYPDFDKDTHKFADSLQVSYISFWTKPSHYKTTDGIHMYRAEGERISADIADSIQVILNNRLMK
jgi:hypothetical protein